MSNPYDTRATDSFQAARNFATTDPKFMRQSKINAQQADRWRVVKLPKPLHALTKLVAKDLYNYDLLPELPPEVTWLSKLGDAHEGVISFVHDFTGIPWGFEHVAKSLNYVSVAISCSTGCLKRCETIKDLALQYVHILPWSASANNAQHVAGFSFGCRIAYRMAQILQQRNQKVSLILLDGPCGPDKYLPPRMNGLLSEVVRVLQRRHLPPNVSPDLVRPLQHLIKLGAEACDVALKLIQLPDTDEDYPFVCPSLFVACTDSFIQTNGTLEAVKQRHVPSHNIQWRPSCNCVGICRT